MSFSVFVVIVVDAAATATESMVSILSWPYRYDGYVLMCRNLVLIEVFYRHGRTVLRLVRTYPQERRPYLDLSY